LLNLLHFEKKRGRQEGAALPAAEPAEGAVNPA